MIHTCAMRDCVIVAAGASRRMEGLWKPTLPLGDSTIIGKTVAAARGAGLRVLLVVGFRGEELAAHFRDDPGVFPVVNTAWESGLPGSLLRGAAAAETEEVFLMNGDKPLVRSGTYRLMADEADRRTAAGLPTVPLFAAFESRAGHPVLVRRDRVLAYGEELNRPENMKAYLNRFGSLLVECGDPGVLVDIDTRKEYEYLLSNLQAEN